jgi:hypothetical protein
MQDAPHATLQTPPPPLVLVLEEQSACAQRERMLKQRQKKTLADVCPLSVACKFKRHARIAASRAAADASDPPTAAV